MTQPNILLILTDQHRYDILGVNGSAVCRSPSLDGLAASGVNFSRAYSVCGLCTPARASTYTGLLPHRHGLARNIMGGDPNPGRIPESMPTLAERLAPAGYDSHFIGKWHAGDRLPTECGFTGMDFRGYGNPKASDDYVAYLAERGLKRPQVKPVGSGWAHNLGLAGVASGPPEAAVPAWLAERTIEHLEGRAGRDRPFFLALNFWGPHAPYFPSEPYASMYSPADIPPWGNFADDLSGKPPIHRRYRDAFIGEGRPTRTWEECARWAALYFGCATQIDAEIGRVLASLDDLGLADETAVIFSCDHGDLTGAHGGMHDKGGMMVEETYHIPAIARVPGGASGAVSDLPASNMDIPATVLELAGLRAPDDIDGRSLVPILEGRRVTDWPDYVAAEFFGHHYAYETRMVVHGDFKYVFHPGATDELYDLAGDPWELTNLIDSEDCAGALAECRRRLIDWAKETGDELCILCGLFHERLPGPAPYTTESMGKLRRSPTRFIE